MLNIKMKNYHQKSTLISPEMILKIGQALDTAWSRETADPDSKDQWSDENKSVGQCAVTSVLIYDLFGGRMIYDKANFHIWNELPDGSQHDFTRSQFTDERIFSIYKYKTKDDILFDERGKRVNLEARYNQLKQNLSLKTIVFATGNDRKLGEARLGCQLCGIGVEQARLDIQEIQSDDPGEISGNKARSAFNIVGRPVVVTDTFWNIPALHGFPGGYMKYIAQWFDSDDFFNLMKGKSDRRVAFTESITYIDSFQTKTFSKEYWGIFTDAPRGTGNSIENVAEFAGFTLGERRSQKSYSHKPEEYIWYDFAKWFSK